MVPRRSQAVADHADLGRKGMTMTKDEFEAAWGPSPEPDDEVVHHIRDVIQPLIEGPRLTDEQMRRLIDAYTTPSQGQNLRNFAAARAELERRHPDEDVADLRREQRRLSAKLAAQHEVMTLLVPAPRPGLTPGALTALAFSLVCALVAVMAFSLAWWLK